MTFPQPILPKPNDCMLVIRSMVRLDASFRRGCGFVIIQGAKRVYRRSKAQENAGGYFAGFFGSVVQSFLCQENAGRKKSARVWPSSPEALQSVGQPSSATSSLPVCAISCCL